MLNEEQDKKFLHDIHSMEERYQDHCVINILSVYFGRSKRDIGTHKKTSKRLFVSTPILLMWCI